MAHAHLDTKLLVDMLCQVLRAIDGAMLATRAAEGEHQRRETSLDVARHMGVGKFIDMVEEREYLAIILKETDYRLVESCEFLVRLISPWVVGAAAVEHIPSPISALVLRDSLAVGETIDAHDKRPFAVILREGGRSVLRVCLIDVAICCLITVGTLCHRLFLLRKLRQFGKTAQEVHHIWIREHVEFHQFTQVLYCRRYAVEEMLLALELSTETVCAKHLKGAEQHEERQTRYEMTGRGHFYIVAQTVVILIDEFSAQLMRILGRSLP